MVNLHFFNGTVKADPIDASSATSYWPFLIIPVCLFFTRIKYQGSLLKVGKDLICDFKADMEDILILHNSIQICFM